MRTDPRWVCGVCKRPVAGVGDGALEKMRKHREKCPKAKFRIKQVPQGAKR